MSLVSLISTYGYVAIFFGGIFEGEAVLVLGGLAAYGGFLKLPLVLLSAFMGALISDWSLFFIGRRKGKRVIEKWPKLKKIMLKPQKLIDKKAAFISFALRFMYGFRIVAPLSLGMSSIKTATFLFFNLLGLMLWVFVVGISGYFFGDALELFLGRLKRYEFKIIVITIIGMFIVYSAYAIIKYLLRKTFGNQAKGSLEKEI